MLEDTSSHFVMIFQSHRGMYQLDNDRTYALVLDRGYPEWLNIDLYSVMLRNNYEINFYLALLIQIEVDYDDNPFTKFSQIRRFFLNNFKKNLVSADKEGVWSLPEDEIKKAIFKHFQLNPYNIVSTQGIWQEEFEAAIQNKP
jgi:hypothetical protein